MAKSRYSLLFIHPLLNGNLERHGPAIAENYSALRRINRAYRFQWPTRDGISLYAVIREALEGMTDGRCAYCDGHPIAAMGEAQIDHFRPKSREELRLSNHAQSAVESVPTEVMVSWTTVSASQG